MHVKRREQRGTQELLVATMTVGYKFFRESFSTQVTLDEPARNILVEYLDGPFSHLENRWHFEPLGEGRCAILLVRDRSAGRVRRPRGQRRRQGRHR